MTWADAYGDYLMKTTRLAYETILQIVSRVRSVDGWMKDNLKKGDYPHGSIERMKNWGRPSGANTDILRKYFDDIESKHPVDYRMHVKAALRRYYLWLHAQQAIKEIPDLDIPIRKNVTDRGKEMFVLTDSDVAALRRHFNDYDGEKEYRDSIMFTILIQLGVRKGELLMLRFSDFKHDINQVAIRSTKTEDRSAYGGARVMPLSPSLSRSIKAFQGSRDDSENLFTVTAHTVWQIIKDVGIALKIEWLKPHAFRHHCITKFCQAVGDDGATPVFNIKEISMMFGVSPEVIAKTYYHPSTENIVSKALKADVYSDA